ncbi:ABC transporter permease [Seramator thermalis]|jgi:ABC-2 type transport system permease protein|uniref:ABC transporter permease n=1 Tax=Seramator thermalis TaxID=2496270 RepID=UPI001EEDE1EB|nr:ABC transporter permease subunit [Seramator thermalis]
MVGKEISDQVRSWRFIIMGVLIALTCLGSLYTALAQFSKQSGSAEDAFFFLNLFTLSDGTLPPFTVFISFLGPLLGISLGFDAINSEQNRGTLSRLLSQPIYRDYVINAKFVADLIVISSLFLTLGLLVLGSGLIALGIPPTGDELARLIFFILVSIIYVAFWLNLSILFSVVFRQAATSALSGIAIWLFFSIFYNMIVDLLAKAMAPKGMLTEGQVVEFQNFVLGLMRFNPSQLFSEATITLLMPSVRSLGALTMEQIEGALPTPLPIGQSLLMVWPQVTGLVAGSILLFGLGYYLFMRREVRSR